MFSNHTSLGVGVDWGAQRHVCNCVDFDDHAQVYVCILTCQIICNGKGVPMEFLRQPNIYLPADQRSESCQIPRGFVNLLLQS